MVEQIAEEADRQSFIAYDDAIFEEMWFTRVWFKQWGFAQRFVVTAGRWEAF